MLTCKSEEKEKEVYQLITKMISLLKHQPDDFPDFILKKKMFNMTGMYDYQSICLGVFYDLVPTLIHEMLHYMHPDWAETKVLKTEKLIKRYT
jgi:hypothetical protein